MGGHVLFLLENQPYPYDPRVRAQVRALVDAGYQVTVAGPTGEGFEDVEETLDGVQVRRFSAPPSARGAAGYVREYGVAFLRLARLVWRTTREGPIDLFFVCNPPDFLALLTLPFSRHGAAVVFDDRELSPELFEAKYGRRGVPYRLLLLAERWAFGHADAVLITNESYADNVVARGRVERDRVFVVGNGPDPDRIFPVAEHRDLRRGREHLVLWMGAMSRQEGLERLVEAADELVNRRGRADVAFALVGPGDIHEDLIGEVERRRLGDVVEVTGQVDDDLVRAYMATADVCVAVDRPSNMNDRAAMRKVLEYMAMARPVVQFPLKEMVRLCGDATVYCENGDARKLADRIDELLDDPAERARLGAAAQARVAETGLMWPDQVPALLEAAATAVRRASQRRRRP